MTKYLISLDFEVEDGDGEALWARHGAAVHLVNALQQVLAAITLEEVPSTPRRSPRTPSRPCSRLSTPRSEKIDESAECKGSIPLMLALVVVVTSYAP